MIRRSPPNAAIRRSVNVVVVSDGAYDVLSAVKAGGQLASPVEQRESGAL